MKLRLLLITFLFLQVDQQAFSQSDSPLEKIHQMLSFADSVAKSNPNRAEDTLLVIIEWAETHGLDREKGKAYQYLTRIYTQKAMYDQAIQALQASMAIFQELGDQKEITRLTLYMGLVHKYLKLFDRSIEYYLQAEKLSLKHGYKDLFGSIYGNLGNVYFQKGEFEKARNAHLKSLEIDQASGNLEGTGRTFHNLAMIYGAQSDYPKAEEFYNKSLTIERQFNNLSGQVITLLELSKLAIEQKEFLEALSYSEEGLRISDSMDNLPLKRQALALFPVIYAAMGDISSSLAFQEEYKEVSDSLQVATMEKEIARVRANYLWEKQEKELELQEARLENQDASLRLGGIMLIGLSLIFLLAVGLIYLLIVRNKLKQKNLKLAQAEAAHIKKLDQIKSQFFTNISHEFRTPLHLILAPLQKKESQINSRDIRMMERNGHRLLRLVNQMLDLGKLEMGMLSPTYRQQQLLNFLREIVQSFYPLAQNKGISLQSDVPDRGLMVWFDPDIIEKIVYNLLSNAIKFTPPNGRVSFHTSIEPGDKLRIAVSDTGLGVPSDLKDKIFDRFYQTSESRTISAEGTGIGLALTKELVEVCQGQIYLDSEQGKGSSFTILLPFYRERPEGATVSTQPINSKPSLNLGEESKEVVSSFAPEPIPEDPTKPSILIVEDHEELRQHLKGQLTGDFLIQEAENGEIGLQIAKSTVPDLIITDVMMPVMDGVAMTKGLKQDKLTSHIPLIMLTAKDDVHSRKEGFVEGVDQYMSKPFDVEELKARISSLLSQRNLIREKFSREVVIEPTQINVPDTEGIFLEELIATIEKHLMDEGFTVGTLQKMVGLSRMQLHRKIKALTGQSTSEFVRTIRLKRAAQLLQDPHIQVAEAAYQSGFSHLSYFSKCFKEQFGVLPSEFSKKVSQKA